MNETIRRCPSAIRVFNELGVDACCGGAASLAAAAHEAGLTPDELLEALRRAEGCVAGASVA